jgi:hypothetical protein
MSVTNPNSGSAYAAVPGANPARNSQAKLLADPAKYASISDFIDPSKPDNRDLLVKTYGDQGITGFLQLTGAVKAAAVNDEIQWWEEGRLHNVQKYSGIADLDDEAGTAGADSDTSDGTLTFGSNPVFLQKNDVIMTEDNQKWIVKSVTGTTSAVIQSLDNDDAGFGGLSDPGEAIILGNMYAQGTEQPGSFFQPEAIKRTNPFMIVKGNFEVSGSQATNIGWIDIGGGEYRWYMKGEQDARKRFQDHREMMLLFGTKPGHTVNIDGEINGSEGYFDAIEDRGIVATSATFENLTSPQSGDGIDDLILALDKQGGASEYAMYLNRATELKFDDTIATGLGSLEGANGVMGQFGAFNNDRDMAVQLGFKTATRGGYTFHKHSWKLMNDPTLAGAVGSYKGAMVPLTTVTDAGTGEKAPALELNYKAVNGYSRELEHWVTGGGVLGHTNGTKDTATFSYRSEIALCTRAANRHVLIKD